VTRFQPSVLRAGVMALILLYGACRGRVGDARYALCVTVLMLLAVDPRLAASVGLQLSATATAGVLLVSPLLRRRLPQQLPPRLRDVVAVTGGAQLTVMPLLLGTFGTVSLVAFPANVLAAFFVLPAAVFGFLGAIGAVIHPLIGSAVFFLASPFAAVVIRIAHFFAPLPVVLTWRSAAVLLLIVVGVIGLYRLRRRLVVLVAVVVIVGLFATLWQLPVRTGDDALVLTAIDVGQGDAWLVEYDGVRIMVDAGTDGTAARWMRRHGRRAVDLLVLTHPHLDHIGGAVEVLNRLRVAHVWMMTYDDDGALAAQVRATAQQQNSVLAEPPVFATVALGQMQISVLNPPPNRSYSATSSEWNNESIVLRIVAPTGSVLLLGDTEDAAHQRLLTSGFDLSADVIAVPHHGSATTDLALFRAVGAHTAVLSVGGDNPYGHPHREVIAALNAAQTRIVRTDENGTVRIVVTAAQRVAAASVANDEGVQDERRYRRTVRRVRPGRGEPRRVGPHDPCQQDGGCSRATRETSRGSRWRQSAPRQHFGV